MAKNRFNTRASYDSSFKYSGQLMPSESKSSILTKKKMASNVLAKISSFYKSSVDVMNDWEAGFVKSIIDKGFDLSPKQKNTFMDIFDKIQRKKS